MFNLFRTPRRIQPALTGSELRRYNEIRNELVDKIAESAKLLENLGKEQLRRPEIGSSQILLGMLKTDLACPQAAECLWANRQDALRYVNTTVHHINTVRNRIDAPIVLSYTSFAPNR